jgi:hypothetical protein
MLFLADQLAPDVTLAQVRLIMAEEEKEKAEAGSSAIHDVSAGAFLLLGTEIQNLQCVLCDTSPSHF